jgi:hypothetical protein
MSKELRIEFTERYIDDLPTDDEIETARNLKLAIPKGKVKFRLIYPRLRDVFMPREIPKIKDYCEIEFISGETLTVMGSFQEVAFNIDERSKLAEQEEAP